MKPEILKNVGQLITTLPDGFTPHKGIQRVYDARRKMIETGEGVDWATAEALAFATLLVEGTVFYLFVVFQCSKLSCLFVSAALISDIRLHYLRKLYIVNITRVSDLLVIKVG